MLKNLLNRTTNPKVQALPISGTLKSFLYEIMNHGPQGASTFDLQAEQYGNISAKVRALQEAGVIIKTIYKTVIDKRGQRRRRVAHRIFIGFDHSITGV